jgi:hypothetical protein
MTDWQIHARVAAAAGVAAQRQGLARVTKEFSALYRSACDAIEATHRAEQALISAGTPAETQRSRSTRGA